MTHHKHDILILGSGMTGLCLGQLLKKTNPDVLLLEKSKGPGGRMANRRFAGASFDTGAQFIRARSKEFRDYLRPYLKQASLRLWKNDDDNNPLYWGNTAMTTFPKAMALDLNIDYQNKVTSIRFDQKQWVVQTNHDREYLGNKLIISSPLPQTLELFKESELQIHEEQLWHLSQISYRKTLALMSIIEPEATSKDVWLETKDIAHIDRLSNQMIKGNSDNSEAVLFHFDHDFSKKWFDKSDEEIIEAMQEVLKSTPFKTIETQIKKWRYADPFTTYGELFLKIKPYSELYLAGDAFGGGSVEGAWRSAQALSTHLITNP